MTLGVGTERLDNGDRDVPRRPSWAGRSDV